MTTTPTIKTSSNVTDHRRSVSDAGNELRAHQACRELETRYGAVPAYRTADGGYTGEITIDPSELLDALGYDGDQ